MNRRLINILKVAVTLVGLGLVLSSIPLGDILNVLSSVSIPGLALALLMVAFSFLLRALRWWILLRGLNSNIAYGRLVSIYLVGNFFNAFLPSGFGGDAVRIMEASRDIPTPIAAGTVIVDRLSGLLMLFLLALLALPFRSADFPENLALFVFAISLVGLITGFVLLNGRLLIRFGKMLPPKFSPDGDGFFGRLMQAVQGSGRQAIAGAMLVSILFNLLLVGWWAVAGRALGLRVPFGYYLLVVPVLSVALLVPSISGLGVREYLAPLLFADSGINASQAVALSLLIFIIIRIISLIGAPIYLINAFRRTGDAGE